MFIHSLSIKNFRNLKEQRIFFNPKYNFIFGKNAQGKTNIIEAIYLLSYGKSFRTSEYRDLINWENDGAAVRLNIVKDEIQYEIEASLNKEKKEFYKDDKRISSVIKTAALQAILFSPEEVLLLKNAPSARRDYLDKLIGKLEHGYDELNSDYKKVVLQRNKILSDEEKDDLQKARDLEVWDEQLIELGSKLIVFRADWVEKINCFLPNQYKTIASEDKETRMFYKPFCGGDAVKNKNIVEKFQNILKEERKEELARGQTVVGPHKDDFCVEIGGHDAKHFGSQGQHRTITLSLKMSEMELCKKYTGAYPIFLLDDVASELDEARNKKFFEYLKDAQGQVFVTATALKDINLSNIKDFTSLFVENGSVSGA